MASLDSVREWHDETDVLVCGFGMSGAAAAIEACDSDPGADVLLIEKMPESHAGGNARVSGQSLLISKDVAALKSYQRAMSATNPIPEDMLDAWARRMRMGEGGLLRFLREQAVILIIHSGATLATFASRRHERRHRVVEAVQPKVVG